jgi:hypothetical protein
MSIDPSESDILIVEVKSDDRQKKFQGSAGVRKSLLERAEVGEKILLTLRDVLPSIRSMVAPSSRVAISKPLRSRNGGCSKCRFLAFGCKACNKNFVSLKKK